MVILGMNAFNFNYVPTPTNINNITSVSIRDAKFDALMFSRNSSISTDNGIPSSFDVYTVLNATFENGIEAGNIEFDIENTSHVLIKRRIKGTFAWTTIYQIEIESIDSFQFLIVDKYNQNKVTYEYAIVPIINGIEGEYSIAEVESSFEGAYIINENNTFSTILNITLSFNQTHPNLVQETMGDIKPHYTSYSRAKYKSGSLTALWINRNASIVENEGFDIANGWKYRDAVMDFCQDDTPKVLKLENGYIGIVQLSTSTQITETYDSAILDAPTTTIDWTEIDDFTDTDALIENGFVSIDDNLRDNYV